MQVVYSRAHLGHDITTETVFGRQIPANEVAERAEIIRRSLESDGGFSFAEPSEHGESPIMAVADYAVIGDLSSVVPAISAEIERRRSA